MLSFWVALCVLTVIAAPVLAMSWGPTAPFTYAAPTSSMMTIVTAPFNGSDASLLFTFSMGAGQKIKTQIYDPVQRSWGGSPVLGPQTSPTAASLVLNGDLYPDDSWHAGVLFVDRTPYPHAELYHYDFTTLSFSLDFPMYFNPPALNFGLQTIFPSLDRRYMLAIGVAGSEFVIARITIPDLPIRIHATGYLPEWAITDLYPIGGATPVGTSGMMLCPSSISRVSLW